MKSLITCTTVQLPYLGGERPCTGIGCTQQYVAVCQVAMYDVPCGTMADISMAATARQGSSAPAIWAETSCPTDEWDL